MIPGAFASIESVNICQQQRIVDSVVNNRQQQRIELINDDDDDVELIDHVQHNVDAPGKGHDMPSLDSDDSEDIQINTSRKRQATPTITTAEEEEEIPSPKKINVFEEDDDDDGNGENNDGVSNECESVHSEISPRFSPLLFQPSPGTDRNEDQQNIEETLTENNVQLKEQLEQLKEENSNLRKQLAMASNAPECTTCGKECIPIFNSYNFCSQPCQMGMNKNYE